MYYMNKILYKAHKYYLTELILNCKRKSLSSQTQPETSCSQLPKSNASESLLYIHCRLNLFVSLRIV